jgi:outer membrane lipoprotein SlyB
MKKTIAAVMMLFAITNVAAQDRYSGSTYYGDQVQRAQEVAEAQVMNIRQVEIKTKPKYDGTTIGTVIGGLTAMALAAASANAYTVAAIGVGAGVVGGVYGQEVVEHMNTSMGYEFTLKLRTGQVVTITQANIDMIAIGDIVYITKSQDGTIRVYEPEFRG